VRGSGETFRRFGEDVVARSCAPRVAARGNQGKIEDGIKAAPLLPFGGSTRGFGCEVNSTGRKSEGNFFFPERKRNPGLSTDRPASVDEVETISEQQEKKKNTSGRR
jgi:hypothetical protein